MNLKDWILAFLDMTTTIGLRNVLLFPPTCTRLMSEHVIKIPARLFAKGSSHTVLDRAWGVRATAMITPAVNLFSIPSKQKRLILTDIGPEQMPDHRSSSTSNVCFINCTVFRCCCRIHVPASKCHNLYPARLHFSTEIVWKSISATASFSGKDHVRR